MKNSFKNSMKPDINSVDPDQLLLKPADQDPHCFLYMFRDFFWVSQGPL